MSFNGSKLVPLAFSEGKAKKQSVNPRTNKPYSLKQIYKMINEGTIKSVKIDGRIFVVTN